MKGYVVNNGAVVMSENENNGNVIGYMVTDEKRAEINIPTKYANVIRLANVSNVISAFKYATDRNCPVHIGQFGIWMDSAGWHVTSFGEMDILNQMFAISYKA